MVRSTSRFLHVWILAVAVLAAALPLPAGLDPSVLSATAQRSTFRSDGEFSKGETCSSVRRQSRLLTPTVTVGEPILFEILLTGLENPMPELAEFTGRFDLGRGVRVTVYPPRDRPYEVEAAETTSFSPHLTYTLKPGETVSALFLLAHDPMSPNGAVTFESGRFGVVLELQCLSNDNRRQYQEIGRFVVNVVPEAGPDAEVADLLLDQPGVYHSIQKLGIVEPRHREVLRQIVEEFPQSSLHPHAMITLANDFYAQGIAIDGDRIYLEDAIPLYRRFLKEYPGHPLEAGVYLKLARALSYSGRDQEAREVFMQIWRDPYLSNLLRPQEELRKWAMGDPKPPVMSGFWWIYEEPSDANRPDSALAEDQQNAQAGVQAQIQQAVMQALAGNESQ